MHCYNCSVLFSNVINLLLCLIYKLDITIGRYKHVYEEKTAYMKCLMLSLVQVIVKVLECVALRALYTTEEETDLAISSRLPSEEPVSIWPQEEWVGLGVGPWLRLPGAFSSSNAVFQLGSASGF